MQCRPHASSLSVPTTHLSGADNFGFSTHYQLQDASGNGVGESDSDYFARTLSVKNAANTTEVRRGVVCSVG